MKLPYQIKRQFVACDMVTRRKLYRYTLCHPHGTEMLSTISLDPVKAPGSMRKAQARLNTKAMLR